MRFTIQAKEVIPPAPDMGIGYDFDERTLIVVRGGDIIATLDAKSTKKLLEEIRQRAVNAGGAP